MSASINVEMQPQQQNSGTDQHPMLEEEEEEEQGEQEGESSLEEAMQSALPGQSERKFMNSLSVRHKRRQRRRLEAVLESGEGTSGLAGAASADAEELLPDDLPDTPQLQHHAQQHLQQHQELMQEELNELPGLVAHMRARRSERENLRYHFRKISNQPPLKQKLKLLLRRKWQSISELASQVFDRATLGLYRSSFVTIEGKFGSGCASYFSFIRWLFVFNTCLSVLIICSFVLPYFLIEPQLQFSDSVQLLPVPDHVINSSEWNNAAAIAIAVRCTQLVEERVKNVTVDLTPVEYVTSIVTGSGWMLDLPIFLGSFFNKSSIVMRPKVNTTPSDAASVPDVVYTNHFDTAVAAVIVLIVFVVLAISAVLASANSLYRKILQVSSIGSSKNSNTVGEKLSVEIFSTWDYGLRSQKAVRQRHRTIAKRLHSTVLHMQLQEQARSNKTLAVRIAANISTLLLFTAAAFLIYSATETQSMLATEPLEQTLRLIVNLLPQLAISAVNIIVPVILGKLIKFEYYPASTEIVIQLMRVVLLKLLSLVTLLITIGTVIGCNADKRDTCGNCPGIDTLCWETYVGQQLYRTLVVDLLQTVIIMPVIDFLRWLLSVKLARRVHCCRMVPQAELLISNDVLSLVYTQSLCFAVAFFCPFAVPLAAAAYGCLFHVKRMSLPLLTISGKAFRTSRLERFFLDVLLLFIFLLLAPISICLLLISPSRGCSPFRVHQSGNYAIADTISNWIVWSNNDIAILLFNYTVLNSNVHVVTLILLALASYFFYSVIKARDTLIVFLERKLQNESKIKLELANKELQLMRVAN